MLGHGDCACACGMQIFVKTLTGKTRSCSGSKGKGKWSQITYWAQSASTKELQDAISEAARELALRADH
jgi:hypothetical protein